MKSLFLKELKLSASPLSYFFLLFALMFFLPNYPILCGAFFITLGIFQSFKDTRETNDILFSALLPIAKRDVVKGKFLFVGFIEICGILLMGIVAAIRIFLIGDAEIYRHNPLINANGYALGMAFLIFGSFNRIFVAGFFKTAYKIGKAFIFSILFSFFIIALAETLPYFPGMTFLKETAPGQAGVRMGLCLGGFVLYLILTAAAYRRSVRSFELLDL